MRAAPFTALACIVFLPLCALAACVGPRASGTVHVVADAHPLERAPDAAEAAFREVLAEHTRRAVPYRVPMRQADLRATLVTPRLRHAFLQARSSFQGRFASHTESELVAFGSPDEGVDAAMKMRPDGEEQIVVFIAMYVAEQKERDLAANSTIWDTHLVRGNARVAPSSWETVRISPAVQDVFPYVDRFDDFYIARFPFLDGSGRPLLGTDGEPLRLEVKSALADAVVEWTPIP